jgi:hypothetical protein
MRRMFFEKNLKRLIIKVLQFMAAKGIVADLSER